MKLNNKDLYELLKEKEVYYLYHANTVTTSKTFIEQNGLLSRGAVEKKKLNQTMQSSDAIDKVFDVWNDVFIDTVDLHNYFSRQNHYGPVLFKISIDFLQSTDLDIWVTKDNPINWNVNSTQDEKYFISVQELRENWDKYQRQRKMITVKNVSEPILFDYLEQVIVDDPKVQNSGIVFFNEAVKTLKASLLTNPPIKSKISTRQCKNCFCVTNYLNEVNFVDLKRFFL